MAYSHTGQLEFCIWHMAVQRDTVIIITLSLIMSTFSIRSATSQSNSYSIFLTGLSGSRPSPNPQSKLWKCQELNPRPHGQ